MNTIGEFIVDLIRHYNLCRLFYSIYETLCFVFKISFWDPVFDISDWGETKYACKLRKIFVRFPLWDNKCDILINHAGSFLG